eukprot:gene4842-biopygen9843
MPAEISVCLSRVPLAFSPKNMYVYPVIKKIKQEEMDEMKWKDVKTLLERAARSEKHSPEEMKCLRDAVCTGQELISREKLSFLVGGIFGGTEDASHITIGEGELRQLSIPKDLANINYIVGQGFEKEYVRKGATEYVFSQGERLDQNTEKFITLSPSVAVHQDNKMFLELNVRWSLAPSGNSWWRQFCGWKNKKEADKDRLVKLVKGRHARTRHSIKKGRGPGRDHSWRHQRSRW